MIPLTLPAEKIQVFSLLWNGLIVGLAVHLGVIFEKGDFLLDFFIENLFNFVTPTHPGFPAPFLTFLKLRA